MADTILVWGRGLRLADPYSRDRVTFALLRCLGYRLMAFSPWLSALGHWQAALHPWPPLAAVWVPCFRQRDVAAAARFARQRRIPLIVDPLISAYDKQVNERHKFAAHTWRARALLAWERRQLARADLLLADTAGHAHYFETVLGVDPARLQVLPVGADATLFQPSPLPAWPSEGRPVRVLFYGSFIALHGVPTIVEALATYRGPPLEVQFIGAGPDRAAAEARLAELASHPALRHVLFSDWMPIAQLAQRLTAVDLVLGVFGTSGKARRVVPNKVYQALASGRPVITADTPAFGPIFRNHPIPPLAFIPPGDSLALARRLAAWAADPAGLSRRGKAAASLYQHHFAVPVLRARLAAALTTLGLAPRSDAQGPLPSDH